MPASLARKDYLLSEAFELVGERLFGPEWSGSELTARKAPSVEELTRDRQPLEAKIADLDTRWGALQTKIGREIASDRIAELKAQRSEVQRELAEAFDKLSRLPEPTAHHAEDHARWLRRQQAEETLRAALAAGQVASYCLHGLELPAGLWAGEAQPFAYVLELSVVRVPRSFSSRRHQSARVREDGFDLWLSGLPRIVPLPAEEPSMGERCRAWLVTLVARGPKTKIKAAYYEDARRAIPRLPRTTFDSEWNSVVPPSWRKSGPLTSS